VAGELAAAALGFATGATLMARSPLHALDRWLASAGHSLELAFSGWRWGLSMMPELVLAIADTMTKIQEAGVAILLVEQNVKIALGITQRTYLIENGNIRWHGASADLARDYDTRRRYLGV
jgi:hypothetical protein